MRRLCVLAATALVVHATLEDVPTTPAVSSDNPAKDMGAVGAMLMPMLDTNKDGKLDKEEVKAIMKGMSDEVTQNFMAGLDTDGDGLIDKEEGKKFVDVLQSVTGGLLLNQGGRKKDAELRGRRSC